MHTYAPSLAGRDFVPASLDERRPNGVTVLDAQFGICCAHSIAFGTHHRSCDQAGPKDYADAFYSDTVMGGEWPDGDADGDLHYSDAFMQGVLFVWMSRHAGRGCAMHPNDALKLAVATFPHFQAML